MEVEQLLTRQWGVVSVHKDYLICSECNNIQVVAIVKCWQYMQFSFGKFPLGHFTIFSNLFQQSGVRPRCLLVFEVPKSKISEKYDQN